MARKWTEEEKKAFGEKPELRTSKYRSVHQWVEVRLGKPHRCEDCGDETLKHRQYHWANVSGLYKRSLEDWKRLCVVCHKKMDGYGIRSGWCKNGHEVTEENTYFKTDGVSVECLTCKHERAKVWYQNNKERLALKRQGALV